MKKDAIVCHVYLTELELNNLLTNVPKLKGHMYSSTESRFLYKFVVNYKLYKKLGEQCDIHGHGLYVDDVLY